MRRSPGFQRANFAVARAAAEEFLAAPTAARRRPTRWPVALDDAAVLRAASSLTVPGRFQVAADAPLTIFDGAHNPSGVAALASALRDAVGDKPLIAVLSVLDDKDAAGMLRELVPLAAGAVFTASAQPARAQPGHARLAVGPARAARPPRSRAIPRAALERAQRARRRGRRRGGHRLDLPGRRPAVRAGAPEGVGAVNPRGPGVLQMVALVAVVVALVILVFFALGYLFGRMFL